MQRKIATIVLGVLASLTCRPTALGVELILEQGDFPDTFATATPLSLPNGTARVSGTIGPTDIDVDFLQFNALAGDWIVLDTERANLPLDTVLSLFDPSGTLVAFNDDNDGNGSETGFGSVIAPFQLPLAGTYRVAVSSFANYPNAWNNSADTNLSWSGVTTEVEPSDIGNSTFDNDGRGETGLYDLIVSRFRPISAPINETEDFNDNRTSAFDLGSGVPGAAIQLNGNIGSENDIDFLKLTLKAGNTLYADTDTLNTELDTVLSLFNSSGTLVAFNDDNDGNGSENGGLGSVIAPFLIPADGDYFLAVTSYSNQPNAFRLSDDTNLIISGLRTGNIESDDLFDLAGEETGNYALSLFIEGSTQTSASVPESSMTKKLGYKPRRSTTAFLNS
jgi:hypothetical protein